VACDTKAAATEFYDLFVNLGLDLSRNILLITKDTESDPAVVRFMEDVNKEAPKYDVVVYNSVMASGVSITSVEPDVVIQIAEYLAPRTNLQLLNRYRRQREVYCFYHSAYKVYGKRYMDLLQDARQRIITEQGILGLPLKDRSELADLRGIIASIAEADYHYQTRSAVDFYTRLLEEDGRTIRRAEVDWLLDGVGATLDDLQALRKERKEEIRRTWHTVRPVSFNAPADADMGLLEIAKGLEHTIIYEALNHYIPADVEPERIYDIVHQFGPKTLPLSFFANQSLAMAQAEGFFSDPNTPETAIHANVTSLVLLAVVVKLWGDNLDKQLTTEDMAGEVGLTFLKRLDVLQDVFNIVSTRTGEDYTTLLEKHDTTEKRVRVFSRILLRSVGLKIGKMGRRRVNGVRLSVWGVTNLQDALDYLSWRTQYNAPGLTPDFSGAVLAVEEKSRADALRSYSELTEADKELVMLRWNGDNTTFPSAVKSVAGEWS
jgi:hypothetical protein